MLQQFAAVNDSGPHQRYGLPAPLLLDHLVGVDDLFALFVVGGVLMVTVASIIRGLAVLLEKPLQALLLIHSC